MTLYPLRGYDYELNFHNFQIRPYASAWLIALAYRYRIPERFLDREEYVSVMV